MKYGTVIFLLFAYVASAQTSWVYQAGQLTVSNTVETGGWYAVSLTRNPDHPYLWILDTNAATSLITIPAYEADSITPPEGWGLHSYDGHQLEFVPTNIPIIINTTAAVFSFHSPYYRPTPYTNTDDSSYYAHGWVFGSSVHETNLEGRPIGAGYQFLFTLGPKVPHMTALTMTGSQINATVTDPYPQLAFPEILSGNSADWSVTTNYQVQESNSCIEIPFDSTNRVQFMRIRFE